MSEIPIDTQAVAIREPVGTVAPIGHQESFASLMALAKELCTTGFLPQAVKTPAQAVAIILTGRELGLGPMQALRSICIIQGKPELAADLQLSIFHRDGGRSKWLVLIDSKAVLWLRHPNGDEHTETFTLEDARRAGLANGQNWQKYPKAMLRSRAITAGLKSIGFEPLAGAYAPGEIGGPEIVGPEPEAVPENAPGRAASPTPPQQTAPTPPPPDAPRAVTPRPLPVPTLESREKMIAQLKAGPGEPNRDLVTEFLVKADILLPGEAIEDIPLRWVPATAKQMRDLGAMIADFGAGGQAAKPYPPNEEPPAPAKEKPAPAAKPIEVPRDPPSPPPNHPEDEWFLNCIVPVPRKGQKRDDYLRAPDTIGSLFEARHGTDDTAQEARQRLWGFLNHFEPKGWTKRDGTEMPPSDADKKFREALDAFSEWHEKNHPDEKL